MLVATVIVYFCHLVSPILQFNGFSMRVVYQVLLLDN